MFGLRGKPRTRAGSMGPEKPEIKIPRPNSVARLQTGEFLGRAKKNGEQNTANGEQREKKSNGLLHITNKSIGA